MAIPINQTTPSMIVQCLPLIKGRFYYSTPNEITVFLVTFKIVRDDLSNDNDPDDNLQYDHEFFYQYYTVNYHVRCKFIPHALVLALLNREYDMNTPHYESLVLALLNRECDVNAAHNESHLTPLQKLTLEQNLMAFELSWRVSDEIIVKTTQD
ncbi:hypothetical protein GLOIN_2v1482134 [Rhizophagus clarus]|nr:hypothetical protein GLOIN_2v1482134 [Rhizophagus clarus]